VAAPAVVVDELADDELWDEEPQAAARQATQASRAAVTRR
jgi:hypothetical protein